MRKGLFISVDGPNGAGKTTFIRTLVENLSVNYDVYDTREPSPTSFGTFVKKNEGGLKGMQYAQLIWADRHYRYDHCFVSKEISKRVVKCCYIHETRKIPITDHSALTLTLDF